MLLAIRSAETTMTIIALVVARHPSPVAAEDHHDFDVVQQSLKSGAAARPNAPPPAATYFLNLDGVHVANKEI